jgi:cell division cycle 2-like
LSEGRLEGKHVTRSLLKLALTRKRFAGVDGPSNSVCFAMASALKRSKWDNQEDSELVVAPQPPLKRRQKVSHHSDVSLSGKRPVTSVFVPQRTEHPPLTSSRSVYSYEKLNSIEEGSYGVVFRARDKQTGDIVALKKLKLDEEKYGFPITALREINALMVCRHDNVVRIREVVVGETLTQYAL